MSQNTKSPMKIAIASGKGGTGKTTVAINLALALEGEPVQVIDCDVEEPNAHLFLHPTFNEQKSVDILIPEVDEETCSFCGTCAEVCEFHAIAVLGKKVLVFPELCHGCGSCTTNCPEHAIHEVARPMGTLERGTAGTIQFTQGRMDVGEAMAVPVIHQLKKWMMPDHTVIIDSPPGASCPVVEALRGADFVLLVTEPTPFGLHDLKGAVEVTRQIGIPFGVLLNRSDVGDEAVENWCRDNGIPILMRIPLDRRIAESYSNGTPMVEAIPEYKAKFVALYQSIQEAVA